MDERRGRTIVESRACDASGDGRLISDQADGVMRQQESAQRVAVRMRVALGLSLTAVAGYVDAIGYLALGGLFASFMIYPLKLLG
jgi:hypothetical protein